MGETASKAIRLLVMGAIICGAVWYFLRHQRHKEAYNTFNAAVAEINQHKYVEAVTHLDEAVKKGYDDPQMVAVAMEHYAMARTSIGLDLCAKNQFAEALPYLEKAVLDNPAKSKENRLQAAIGNCYFKKNPPDFSKAKAAFEQALSDNPEDNEAKLALQSLLGKEKAQSLLAAGEKAAKVNDWAAVYSNYRQLADDDKLGRHVAAAHPWYWAAYAAYKRALPDDARKYLEDSKKKDGSPEAKKLNEDLEKAIGPAKPEATKADTATPDAAKKTAASAATSAKTTAAAKATLPKVASPAATTKK